MENLEDQKLPTEKKRHIERQIANLKEKYNKLLLQEIKNQINTNSLIIPEPQIRDNILLLGGIVQSIDQTTRYPIGKIELEIKDIQNFEWQGENENIFIRISCQPYILFSKRVFTLKKDGSIYSL